MGVGKTTLIKELAAEIGVKETLSSPTFSIVNEYNLPEERLFHFDFYSIVNEEEVLDIGIEDYFETDNWKLIEWPEKIPNLVPKDSITLIITKNQNGSRTIDIELMK